MNGADPPSVRSPRSPLQPGKRPQPSSERPRRGAARGPGSGAGRRKSVWRSPSWQGGCRCADWASWQVGDAKHPTNGLEDSKTKNNTPKQSFTPSFGIPVPTPRASDGSLAASPTRTTQETVRTKDARVGTNKCCGESCFELDWGSTLDDLGIQSIGQVSRVARFMLDTVFMCQFQLTIVSFAWPPVRGVSLNCLCPWPPPPNSCQPWDIFELIERLELTGPRLPSRVTL